MLEVKDPILKKMIDRGIPVWKAEFHSAVNNSKDIPEFFFSTKSNHSSRNIKMWWVNGDGLLCFHENEYFFVPNSNVRYLRFEAT